METLLKRYPNLGPARILDALAFAYDNQELIQADMDREQALFEKQGGPTVGARPLSQLSLPFVDEPPARPVTVSMPERVVQEPRQLSFIPERIVEREVEQEEEVPPARNKSTRKK